MLTIDSSEYLLETLLEAFRRPTIAQDSKPGNWPSTYTEITYPGTQILTFYLIFFSEFRSTLGIDR